jgi:MFS-type transporter involved in bile tolerance (Atg22 family)
VAPWQATFLALGVPGLLFALLVLALREPARRGMMGASAAPGADYRATLAFLWQRRELFLPLIVGFGLLGLLAYGPASQTTLFFVRTYGWSVADVARVNGVLILVSAIPGALFGGWLATRLRTRRPDGTLRTIFYASVALIPPITLLWLSPSPVYAWLGQAWANFAIASSINLNSAVLADVTPNEFRGKVIALNAMVLTLIGLGAGPTLIAMITDYVLHDESQLRWSLVLFSAVVAPLAAVMLRLALPGFARVVDESAGWTGIRQDAARS